MEWLNYHHLFYFWVITQEDGLAKAAARLHVTHSTLSAQLRSLEDFLGAPLFERRGRRLVLTTFGAEVASYAADIFRTGNELVEFARGRAPQRRSVLNIGVVSAIPKTVAYRLLAPALHAGLQPTVHIRQDSLRVLLEELARSRLHMVLSESLPAEGSAEGLHTHALGETEILLYGSAELAQQYKAGFPESLQGAPLLMPGSGSSLRHLLDRWLVDQHLQVDIRGEFDDAGMMRTFGCFGEGLFPVRAALKAELEDAADMVRIGVLQGLRERYYAISAERRLRHAGVAAIVEQARARLLEAEQPRAARPARRRTPAARSKAQRA
ncbi:MAG TPA: LysR family transcriptional regulator [Polyangiales bacterium]